MKATRLFGYPVMAAAMLLCLPAHADETCMSPYIAKIQGQEDYVYVWTLGVEGVGDEQDKLVTIDTNPASETYGKVVDSLSVGGRNEAHHSGLSDDRKYLWAGGLDTNRIFIFDIHTDPRKPTLHKVVTDFADRTGGLVGPHTFYALPGRMMITALSNKARYFDISDPHAPKQVCEKQIGSQITWSPRAGTEAGLLLKLAARQLGQDRGGRRAVREALPLGWQRADHQWTVDFYEEGWALAPDALRGVRPVRQAVTVIRRDAAGRGGDAIDHGNAAGHRASLWPSSSCRAVKTSEAVLNGPPGTAGSRFRSSACESESGSENPDGPDDGQGAGLRPSTP